MDVQTRVPRGRRLRQTNAGVAALVLIGVGLAGCESATEELPGARHAERAEAQRRERGGELRGASLEHYALVEPVEEADLRRWIARIVPRRDGSAFVLAVGDTPELHGGALLDFLFRHWRPHGRAAGPEDRFPFVGREVALGEIYAGHRRQVFLPESSHLPRMRFFVQTAGVAPVERDAYSFLRLLVARESDYAATWTNHAAQELSVDRLLRSAWQHYREARNAEVETADHSNLHLVEVLLAYRRRATAPLPFDANDVKRRFLETELARPVAETDDERLVHYVESLGWLLADPDVVWTADDGARARAWLRKLEDERFADLAGVEAAHLTHLLKGLRAIRARREI